MNTTSTDQIAAEAASVIAGALNLDEKQQPGLKLIIKAAIEKVRKQWDEDVRQAVNRMKFSTRATPSGAGEVEDAAMKEQV